MAEKKADKPESPKGSGSKFKLILLILIALLVLGGGGGAAYYFLFYKAADPADPAAETTEGHAATETHQEPAPAHQPETDAAPAAEHTQVIYHALEPITVNITTPGSVRFLRISLTVVTQNPLVIAAIDKHLPMIRNDLLAQLSALDAAAINTPEGKAALREELRKLIAGILTRASEPSGIQEILFTDLVMQ